MTRPIQPPGSGLKGRLAGIVAAALVISWGGPAASAYWQTLGSGPGTAKADSISALTAAPDASGSSGTASVTWKQGTTAAGRPVSGYTVARYSSPTGPKVPAGGGCLGTVAGLGCTEANLPAGTWNYTVTPVIGSWAGPESARSGAVAGTPIAPPVIASPDVINMAKAIKVEISGTVGSGLSVTVTATDSAGAKRISPTVSASGTQWTVSNFDLSGLADGTITYSAVATDAAGHASTAVTATTTKDTLAPSVSAVALSNGDSKNNNKDGKVEAGDKVALTFSKTLDASSICGAWNNLSPLQTASGLVTISSSNVLTVTANGCPTLRLGTVGLGSNNYSAGTLQFTGSTVVWDQSSRQLTITLGTVSGTPASSTQQASTPVYTPAAGLTDLAGNPLPTAPINGNPASRF